MLDFLFRRRQVQHRLAYQQGPAPWQRSKQRVEPHEEPRDEPLTRPLLPHPAPAPIVLEPAPSVPAFAKLFRNLTYGQAVELGALLAKALPDGRTPTDAEGIAAWLHKGLCTVPVEVATVGA
jgi:hypothetical protein